MKDCEMGDWMLPEEDEADYGDPYNEEEKYEAKNSV